MTLTKNKKSLNRFPIGLTLALALTFAGVMNAPVGAQKLIDIRQEDPDDNLLDRSRLSVAQRKAALPADQMKRLSVARKQIKQRDFDGAAALLELIYRDYPQDPRVIRLLNDCYVQLKRYYSSIEILSAQSATDPLNITPLLDLADVYFKAEKPDSALMKIDRAMGFVVNPIDISRYGFGIRRALNTLLENQHDSLILAYAQQMRTITSDSSLYGDIVASALERRQDYAGATLECFKIIRADSSRAGRMRRAGDQKLAQLIEFEEAQNEVQLTMEQMMRATPTDTLALKYLGELYMKTAQFAPAFDMYVGYDSLTSSDGRQLFHYLRECYDRKLYDRALSMSDYILKEHSKSPLVTTVRFYRAQALLRSGALREAISAYRLILDKDPSRGDKAEAAFAIGEIYSDKLQLPDSAKAMFELVTTKYPSGVAFWKAKFALFQIDIIDGKMQKARRAIHQLAQMRQTEDQGEKVLYYQARMNLIEGKIDSADVEYKRIIERYPKGYYVNNALRTLMIFQQGGEADPELMKLYSKSELYRERRMQDSLASVLEKLAHHEDTTLADIAILELGKIYLQQSDTARALEYFNMVSEQYPGSYFAPYASKYKADIYFQDESRRNQGVAIYRSLLKEYRTYPFAAELRQNLRDIGESTQPNDKNKQRKAVSEA